jgi:hypothetical protein
VHGGGKSPPKIARTIVIGLFGVKKWMLNLSI